MPHKQGLLLDAKELVNASKNPIQVLYLWLALTVRATLDPYLTQEGLELDDSYASYFH
jgi:hypothetical protein